MSIQRIQGTTKRAHGLYRIKTQSVPYVEPIGTAQMGEGYQGSPKDRYYVMFDR